MQELKDIVLIGCDIDGVVYNKIAYAKFCKRLEESFVDPETKHSILKDMPYGEFVAIYPVVRSMWMKSVQESLQFVQKQGDSPEEAVSVAYHVLDPVLDIMDDRLGDEGVAACQEVVLMSASARQSVGLDKTNAFTRLRESGVFGLTCTYSDPEKANLLMELFGTPLAMEVVHGALTTRLQQDPDAAHMKVMHNPALLPDMAKVTFDAEGVSGQDVTNEVVLRKMGGGKLAIFAGLLAQGAKLTIFIDDREDLFSDWHSIEKIDSLPGAAGMHLAGIHVREAEEAASQATADPEDSDGVEGLGSDKKTVMYGYDYTDHCRLGELQKTQAGKGSYVEWLTARLKACQSTARYTAHAPVQALGAEFEKMRAAYRPAPVVAAAPVATAVESGKGVGSPQGSVHKPGL